MRIIRWNDLDAVPWKNGQGITREIAKEPSGAGFVWRLSVADVAGDGPFSQFDGMRRILTVVDGNGMELEGQNRTFHADLGVPVEFDGALDITSRLKGGPLRDLNLIFNPQQCSGEVRLLKGAVRLKLLPGEKQVLALYCMAGAVELEKSQTLRKGDTAIPDGETCHLQIGTQSEALLVSINLRPAGH